jgi:hypothetical protein
VKGGGFIAQWLLARGGAELAGWSSEQTAMLQGSPYRIVLLPNLGGHKIGTELLMSAVNG